AVVRLAGEVGGDLGRVGLALAARLRLARPGAAHLALAALLAAALRIAAGLRGLARSGPGLRLGGAHRLSRAVVLLEARHRLVGAAAAGLALRRPHSTALG